jgi:hypothetical protein
LQMAAKPRGDWTGQRAKAQHSVCVHATGYKYAVLSLCRKFKVHMCITHPKAQLLMAACPAEQVAYALGRVAT